MKLSLLQKQALKTGLIAVFILVVTGILLWFFFNMGIFQIVLAVIVYFILIYLLFISQMKKFIYLQLQRVYESNLFENEPVLKNRSSELDFERFIQKIIKFAETKHQEIEQLHDRDDFRKDFLGDVSHELKTPLFTAQGYLLTVLDNSIEDPDLRRKYLERTNKSIERLGYIVKDLDMIARLESGMKLEQSDFNIVKTLADVFELFELKAGKKNIRIDFKEPYEFPIMVRADKEKIEQVAINLISNSIKYGKPGGSTLVSIEAHSVHQMIIKFEDDGVGIQKENLPRLFERFYRVDKSRSRDQGGSGLGLAIVKHIIEAHDQEVLVESEPGTGSIFSFTLNKAV
ncbi:sensor histidine kinase [Lutimonas saemankumensis]|uniref:sensor histidine kinase n=1 Tax=Lutimonas saemankumensis TaxID=483016 RepID=UPI001CD29427|nr:ATP-binding protein [Lutimonas saemankumensis]MCA0932924.1 sensor histidine kinase [Lutimonas saemankumensis]